MKTVRISKKAIALAGSLLLTAIVFFASMIPSTAAASSDPQPMLPTVSVGVITLPPITVTLPPIVKTVTNTVRERVTVTKVLPKSTVTVKLPGNVKTVTVAQPARTVTKTVTVRQPQATRTVVQTRQLPQATVTLPPVTQTTHITGTPSPAVTTTALVTVEKEKPVIITRTQALLSAVGLAILGALAGILVLGAYRLGWFRGDSGNRQFIEQTVDDLKYNK